MIFSNRPAGCTCIFRSVSSVICCFLAVMAFVRNDTRVDVYTFADPQSMNYHDELPQWTTLNFLPWKKKITKAWLSIDIKKIYLMAKTHRYHNSRGTPCRPVITWYFQQKNTIYIEDTTGFIDFVERTRIHPSIKFTAEISGSKITFLDKIIYRGGRFQIDSLLDIKTHSASRQIGNLMPPSQSNRGTHRNISVKYLFGWKVV